MGTPVCLVPGPLGGSCSFLGVAPPPCPRAGNHSGFAEALGSTYQTQKQCEGSLRRTPGSEPLSSLPTVSLLLEMCSWNLKAGCAGLRPGLSPRPLTPCLRAPASLPGPEGAALCPVQEHCFVTAQGRSADAAGVNPSLAL